VAFVLAAIAAFPYGVISALRRLFGAA